MLLQTNSYIVPKEKRAEHARLMRRFRQVLHRLGCDNFEVYEQVGANWSNSQTTGRFVQIMRFRDRKHQMAVQNAERNDQGAQELIAEFCELVNYPYQQQQGQFAVGFYSSVLPVAPMRGGEQPDEAAAEGAGEVIAADQEGSGVGEAAAVAAGESLVAGAAEVDQNAPADDSLDPNAVAQDAGLPDGLEMTEAEEEAAADRYAQAQEQVGAAATTDQHAAEPASAPTPDEQGAVAEAPSVAEAAVAENGPITDHPAEPVAQPIPAAENGEVNGDGLELVGEAPSEASAPAPSPPPAAPVASQDATANPAEEAPELPAAATAELDDFDLEDLGDELTLTDDDLARLAEELAADPGAPGPHGDGKGQGGATH